MDYKIIKDEEEFIEERNSWNRIVNEMENATPFQTWEWNYIWWKNNEPKDSLFIIKAFEQKQIYGYAPMVVKNNTVEFIGGKDMDYGKFVLSKKGMLIIEGFISIFYKQGYNIALQEMASRDSQLHMVEKKLEANKHYLLHKTTRAAYVNLKRYDNFESYFKLLTQSMRNKTIKVGLKKNLVLHKEDITDELLVEMQKIYSNRQEARVGNSTLEWAIDVIKELGAEDLLNVYVARDKENAVGFLVSMNYNNSQYIWLVAFKQEYRNYFPGQLLFYQAIKDGFEDGNNKVDFMRGDYDFKMRWECEIDTNYTVYVFNSSFKYMKYKFYFWIKPRIKKCIYSHPILERIYKRHG